MHCKDHFDQKQRSFQNSGHFELGFTLKDEFGEHPSYNH